MNRFKMQYSSENKKTVNPFFHLLLLLIFSVLGTTAHAKSLLPKLSGHKIEIGGYLGGAQFTSEYVVSNGFDWAKYSKYKVTTEPSVGIYTRYKLLPWLKGEVSYSYLSVTGDGSIPKDKSMESYTFKSNIHELCFSGVVNLIPLLTSNSSTRWQVNGKAGIGWAHMYPSKGKNTENKPPIKILIPIGGSIGYAIGHQKFYTLSLGYDFRMMYTDQMNQYHDKEDIKELVDDKKFYVWGGYGVFKLGIDIKLSCFKKKKPGFAWLYKLRSDDI